MFLILVRNNKMMYLWIASERSVPALARYMLRETKERHSGRKLQKETAAKRTA